MIKLRLPNPIGIIVHPVDPDIRIEVEKPSAAESLDFWQKQAANVVKKPAFYPDGKPIYKLGELQTITYPQAPSFDMTAELIAKHLKNVYGLDEAFSPEKAIIVLRRFLEPDLAFTEEQDVPILDDDGKPTGQTEHKSVLVNFYTHVVKKAMDQETYARPLESPTP